MKNIEKREQSIFLKTLFLYFLWLLIILCFPKSCSGQDTTCIPNAKLIELAQERREFMYNDSAYTQTIYEQEQLILFLQIKTVQDSLVIDDLGKQLAINNRLIEKQARESNKKWYESKTANFCFGFGSAAAVFYLTALVINKVK